MDSVQKTSERETEFRKERIQKYPGVKVYLKNLGDNIDDDEKLRGLFAEFGTITPCKLTRNLQGQITGVGFVNFSTQEEANRAVAAMNGRMVGTSKPLYVAPAQRKEERRASLQMQFNANPVGVSPAVATSVPMYHPGAPGFVESIFYGPTLPGLIPPQPAFFSYQQWMLYQQEPLTGIRRKLQNPTFSAPVVHRQNQQGGPQHADGRNHGERAPVRWQQHHQEPKQSHVPSMEFNGVSAAAGNDVPQAGPSSAPASDVSQAGPSSAPTSTSIEDRKAMFGDLLYPLVDMLEHDHAGKVTAILLEMEPREIRRLFQSSDALIAKVVEAMEVLRMAQAPEFIPADKLANLSLNEG